MVDRSGDESRVDAREEPLARAIAVRPESEATLPAPVSAPTDTQGLEATLAAGATVGVRGTEATPPATAGADAKTFGTEVTLARALEGIGPSEVGATLAAAVSGFERTHIGGGGAGGSFGLGAPRSSSVGTPRQGEHIGRYVVLTELGAGAMGVVLSAYDPELNRKIALKLLNPRAFAHSSARAGASARLQREAQALAKLSHANVVAVHDVGEHGGHVFIAMEFVEGQTLEAWLQQTRTWEEVVRVFEAAGRGLAAAHAKGLIHRDFKPENVMISEDERVRVMDFGLARATAAPEVARAVSVAEDSDLQLTRAGSLMGTPAYMSPLQFRGEPATASCDQFGFSVALYEGLFGERPFAGSTLKELSENVREGRRRASASRNQRARGRGVVPLWLVQVCERGFANDPEKRWPSLDSLLQAITRGRDRARQRRWLAVAGAIVALGIGLLIVQRVQRDASARACVDESNTIEELWNETTRAGVVEGLTAGEPKQGAATSEKVLPWLDRFASKWREHRLEVCSRASIERSFDADVTARARWCLDEQRQDFGVLLGVFATANDDVVRAAVLSSASLPAPHECLDRALLDALPPPPDKASRAASQAIRQELREVSARKFSIPHAERLSALDDLLARAEALEQDPLTAAIRAQRALVLSSTGAYSEAEQEGRAAYILAVGARAWGVAASAARELARVVGTRLEQFEQGRVWAEHATVMQALAGDPTRLYAAELMAIRANTEDLAGELETAEQLARDALAVYEYQLGDEHPALALASSELANILSKQGELEEAEALHRRTLDLQLRTYGESHPDVTASYNNLGANLIRQSSFAEALEAFTTANSRWERELGPEHMYVLMSSLNIAAAHEQLGAIAEARAIYQSILPRLERALGPEHPNVALVLNNLGIALRKQGEFARSRDALQRALEIRSRVLPGKPDTAQTLFALGQTALMSGDNASAIKSLQQALVIQERSFDPTNTVIRTTLGSLGRAQLQHGRLADARRSLERALEIGEPATPAIEDDYHHALHSLARLELKTENHAAALATAVRAATLLEERDKPPVDLRASADFVLGLALWNAPADAGRDRARARALVLRARDEFQAVDGMGIESVTYSELIAWLESHPDDETSGELRDPRGHGSR